MRRSWKRGVLAISMMFLFAMAAQAQSLGDVARQQREKENATSKHAKVVTDEDMPARTVPDSSDEDSDADDNHIAEPSARPETSSDDLKLKGEQWRARIQAQKNNVAALQSQVDRLNSSIHFVEANRYSNGVQYNQHQLRRQQEARQVQKQLDEQKKKLEDMQEAARHEGFGNKVYDP